MRRLEEVTNGKLFDIHDSVLWTMILDSRDVLVIDLADWAKGQLGKGGGSFLRKFQGPLLGTLVRKPSWVTRPERDGTLREGNRVTYAAARARLFPDLDSSAKVTQADIEKLIGRFDEVFRPVVLDRNQNRAHAFEQQAKGGATAKMLDLGELRSAFEYAMAVVNDLSLVTRGGSMELVDMNSSDVADSAREHIELLLLPRFARERLLRADEAPDTFVAKLHELADTLGLPDTGPRGPATPARTFNDSAAIWRALETFGVARPVGLR